MNTLIKTIEDLSLNAWPSHQIELYDGWILRFSLFLYTPDQQRRADRAVHDSGGGKSAVL